jgi:hypothetical protein
MAEIGVRQLASLRYLLPLCFIFYVKHSVFVYNEAAGTAQSVLQFATGWTVRGSNPGRGEIFRTRPDRPCGPPQPPVQRVPGVSRG